MRRTGFLGLLLCLVLMIGAPAAAQSTVSVRGNVGASFFQSPDGLSSVLNSGVSVGVGGTVHLIGGFGLTLGGGYDQFTLNGDNVSLLDENMDLRGGSTVEGGDYDLLGAAIGLRYVFRNRTDAHPYMTGGVGLYRTTFGETRFYENGQLAQRSPARTTTGLGFHLAMGVDFQINDTYTFFFEPRYVVVDTDDEDFDIGGSTQFIPVQIGLDVGF